MRRPHPAEVAALLLVAVPTTVFSIGCLLPGCGDGPSAPRQVRAEEHPPSPSEGVPPPAVDTAAPGRCDDAAPAVSLWHALGPEEREPLPSGVELDYGGGCGSEGTLWIEVAAAGLQPGPVDVAWQLAVDGQDPLSGAATWEIGCLAAGGMQSGELSIDLPVSANGAAAVLDVVLIDEVGTEVGASHTFVAVVSDDS